MTWGSGVLHTVALDPTTRHLVAAADLADGSGPGKDDMDDTNVYKVISRGINEFNEAPYVHFHEGYFYLWVNWFACCAGRCSTYEIRVGRATSPVGPFVDKNGNSMSADDAATCAYDIEGDSDVPCSGGSAFLIGDAASGVLGPGHAGVLEYI